MRAVRPLLAAVTLSGCMVACTPASASADICSVFSWVSGVAGKACTVVKRGDRLINAGKKVVTGHPGAALKTVFGGGGGGSGGGASVTTKVALAAILAWTVVGAKFALHETAKVIEKTTRPELTTMWFSSTYWRIAGISALLTIPFLCAAAVQALMRSDLSLLARAALGYLPLSLLAVGIAAPVAMLLLAASDEMSAVVSAAAGGAGGHFLGRVGAVFGTLSLVARAPFLVFLAGLLTAAAALALWVEMLMREAAVYIVVLMLPLAFAAMVWPARRVWAVRTVEVLIALILSKFAIVAVLALGGAALGQSGSPGAAGMLTGLVLVLLAAFAPWALLRVLPLAELASSAAGHWSGEIRGIERTGTAAADAADRGAGWAGAVVSGLRNQAAAVNASSEPAIEATVEPGAASTPAPATAATNAHSREGRIEEDAAAAGVTADGNTNSGEAAGSGGARRAPGRNQRTLGRNLRSRMRAGASSARSCSALNCSTDPMPAAAPHRRAWIGDPRSSPSRAARTRCPTARTRTRAWRESIPAHIPIRTA
jgi:hypothetical protein